MFGSTIGSFLNVVIYRLPREQSIVFPPSHCPSCQSEIKWYDNIPILGYIVLGGKCRNCKSHISIQYPIIEFLTATTFVLLMLQFGLTITFFVYVIFSCLLIVAAAVDFTSFIDSPAVKMDVNLALPRLFVVPKTGEDISDKLNLEGILQDEIYTFENDDEVEIELEQASAKEELPSIAVTPVVIQKGIIPDEITFSGIFIALLFALFSDVSRYQFMIWTKNSLENSVAGLLFGMGSLLLVAYFFKLITKKEGMGMGDVKLLGFMGAILGIKLTILAMLMGSLLGILVMLILHFGRREPFPFGPFLAIGAFISLFVGDALLRMIF